jgi:Uncharacterised nucleotidyltransferase
MRFLSARSRTLLEGADPEVNPTQLKRAAPLLTSIDAELFEQAERHGVLGAFLTFISPHLSDPAAVAAYTVAKKTHRQNAVFSRILRMEAEALVANAHGLPITIVKGPVFARNLYPKSDLRCYTDIDILAAESALPRLSEILGDSGYSLATPSELDNPREWQWINKTNNALMVEVQTNLIHADSLVGFISLDYHLIEASPEGAPELLLVALVHGAAHQYDRLQLVVDICQAARHLTGEADEIRLEMLVRAAKSRFAAVVGLRLAGRLMREPRCLQLARGLGGKVYGPVCDMLLAETVVMSAKTDRRTIHSWRRQLFRWLLKMDLD